MNNLKKIISAALIFAAALKNAAAQSGKTTFNAGDKVYMLQRDGCLYKLNDKNQMVWLVNIPEGEELTVIETGIYDRLAQGKIRNDVNFVHVRTNDSKEGWVQADRASYAGDLAIATTECAVYRTQDPSSAENFTLPFGTFVVETGAQVNISSSLSMTQIYYYDASGYAVKKGFIKGKNVSNDSSDIKVATLIPKIKAQTKETTRDEMLSVAKSMNVSYNVRQELYKLEESFREPPFDPDLTENILQTYRVNLKEDENLNLRGKADKNSEVITKISGQSIVSGKLRTQQQQKVGNEVNRWYYVETEYGESGWLFGAYLEEYNHESSNGEYYPSEEEEEESMYYQYSDME